MWAKMNRNCESDAKRKGGICIHHKKSEKLVLKGSLGTLKITNQPWMKTYSNHQRFNKHTPIIKDPILLKIQYQQAMKKAFAK